MRALLASLLLTIAAAVQAGPIADTFRTGVFGLAWGASAAEIEAKFPGGKWSANVGIRSYAIKDGRTVLGIERDARPIRFVLSTIGTLTAVGVEFPPGMDGLSRVMAAAVNTFGPAEPMEGIPGATGARWPVDDGLSVAASALTGITGVRMVMLSIAKAGVAKPADLGFQ